MSLALSAPLGQIPPIVAVGDPATDRRRTVIAIGLHREGLAGCREFGGDRDPAIKGAGRILRIVIFEGIERRELTAVDLADFPVDDTIAIDEARVAAKVVEQTRGCRRAKRASITQQ